MSRKKNDPILVPELIAKKRDGKAMSEGEIRSLIDGFMDGAVTDYQMSAFAMAVFFQGMSFDETVAMTLAMRDSGQVVDLGGLSAPKVDKHSTGGVGDKVSICLAPIVAACGVVVPMMSGRGLGHTGGTLDKLEAIPGFRVDLSVAQFRQQLRKVGCALIGQTGDLAPADKRLYALRDVTGTVESIPLLASSIMSKKIAAGAQALVLDVKVGVGAFKPKLEDGRRLAELMVAIAGLSGRRATALLSDMNQPLGRAAGNALEVKEAIETLHGAGPRELREHCLTVASHMLMLGSVASNEVAARGKAVAALDGGAAWECFRTLVEAQGGDVAFVDSPDRLPKSPLVASVASPRSGFIAEVDARIVGETVVQLGGGRAKKGDPIDHSVGVEVLHNVGDHVAAGDPLFTVHATSQERLVEAKAAVMGAHAWSDEPIEPLPLFYGVISN